MMNTFKFKKSVMYFSLFVKNFPESMTEDQLAEYFSMYGQVERPKIKMIAGTQQAFVNFENQEACKKSRDFTRNRVYNGIHRIYVEYCYPKEMRLVRNLDHQDKRAIQHNKTIAAANEINQQDSIKNIIDVLSLVLRPALNAEQNNINRRST